MSQARVVELDWRAGLNMKASTGLPRAEPGNLYLMLTNGNWSGSLAYDEFGDRTYWAKQPPGMRGFSVPRTGRDITDEDALYVQHYMARIGTDAGDGASYRVSFALEAVHTAMSAAARLNSRHPLRDYLRGLTWDGEKRLPRWCAECLGCEQSDYTAGVGTWWMISAVARALEPGCQADYMLVLEGPQGARKSTALRILAGDWYLPALPDVQSVDAARILSGRWICECGELSAMKRNVSREAIKDFITRPLDVFRNPYGRQFVRRPRGVVFSGTTNEYEFLDDPTGGRRYWPVTCGAIDAAKLRAWRDQLWAESVSRFEAGEQWHPTSELAPLVTEKQEERYQEDSWTGLVLAGAKRHALAPFTLADAMGWAGLTPDKWSKPSETRVGAILNRAGYRAARVWRDGRRVREYVNPAATIAPVDGREEGSDFDE